MESSELSAGKRRILDLLKTGGETSASDLAVELELTDVAVRQHLQGLSVQNLVRSRPRPAQGRGRPGVTWSLTGRGHGFFPEGHAELTVGFIQATRKVFGESGLDKIILARAEVQVAGYRKELPPPAASLKCRVEALAKIRSREGYMAEVVTEKPGQYLLIEHHCPICDAAQSCLGLCSAELDVFKQSLGRSVNVERTAHLLSGDARCAYRITATK